MKNKFWYLTYAENEDSVAEWDDSRMEVEEIICSKDDGHQRSGKRLTDLSVILPKKINDFIWTWYSECLIQEHVLNELKSEGVTGFTSKPVTPKFKRRTNDTIPILSELIITGWGGIAPSKSGIKIVSSYLCCNHIVYSSITDVNNLIDNSVWDGSDFFIIWPLPKYIFITEKVVKIIKNNGFTGISIKKVEDLEFDPKGTFTPGRLSYWMPEERAREIGEPLGIY